MRKQLESLESEGILQRYADQSLFGKGDASLQRFWELYKHDPAAAGLVHNHVYRALAPFPIQLYALLYPKTYWESFMPTPFVAGNFPGSPPSQSEYNLENLALTVGFRRRPRRDMMEQFVAMIQDWYASVRERGMFGEGPIAHIGPEVEFAGLRAQFRVDARGSGQNTLNWFILTALEFGINVFPVLRIALADEEYMENWFGPPTGKVTKLPIQPSTGSAARLVNLTSTDPEPLPEALPADCQPYTEITSKLRLFVRRFFEWDSLHVTVYFTTFPVENQQKEFRKLIEAWATMGYYGGLGGKGIHHLRDICFDEKTDSASFYADMGDAEEPPALSMLVRVLETFSGQLAIEAVVFGHGLPEG